MSELNELGKEVFDQTPVDIVIPFERPTPLHLRIRDQILRVYEDMRSSKEMDTPEEADDFEMDDMDESWEQSPYEGDFDHMDDPKFSDLETKTAPASSESTPNETGAEPSSKDEN